MTRHPGAAHGSWPAGIAERLNTTFHTTADPNLKFQHNGVMEMPDDVKNVAVAVMAHRLIPHPEARMSGFSTERLAADLLRSVPVESSA